MVTVKDIKDLTAEEWTLEQMTDFAQAWMDEAEKQQRIAARLAESNTELAAACEAFVAAWKRGGQLEKTDVALRMAEQALARNKAVNDESHSLT